MSTFKPNEGKSTAVNTCEPVIGSSKRKRKSTIVKRSVVTDNKLNSKTCEETGDEIKKNDELQEKTPVVCKIEENCDNIGSDRKSKRLMLKNYWEDESTSEDVSSDDDTEKVKRRSLRNSDEKPSHKCKSCNLCHDHMSLKQLKEELKTELKLKSKYHCQICMSHGRRRSYSSKEKLEHHVSTSHKDESDPKKFECKHCDVPSWFPTKSKLSYHMNSKHPGVLEFVCEVCTETFKLKANYKNHMQSHNIVVQKKFSCDVCGGTFVNKAGFQLHKKRFPGPHIKQSCEHCGFSFSKESHIRNHRCKKLLMEQAEKARETAQNVAESVPKVSDPLSEDCSTIEVNTYQVIEEATGGEQTGGSLEQEKTTETVSYYKPAQVETDQAVQLEQRVLLTTDEQPQIYYRPVQVQAQNLQESVLLQEFHEISHKNEIIATESDQTIIIRDINVANSSQIFQAVDINDVETSNENHSSDHVVHLNITDWNVVGPYVIKEKSKFS